MPREKFTLHEAGSIAWRKIRARYSSTGRSIRSITAAAFAQDAWPIRRSEFFGASASASNSRVQIRDLHLGVPQLSDDSLTTAEDTTISFDALANDVNARQPGFVPVIEVAGLKVPVQNRPRTRSRQTGGSG